MLRRVRARARARGHGSGSGSGAERGHIHVRGSGGDSQTRVKPTNPKKIESAKRAFDELKVVFANLKDMREQKVLQVLKSHKRLVDAGYVNIDEPLDRTKDTMLHKAAWHGRFHVAKWLLKHGAQVDSRNIKGNTPLHNACDRASNDRTDVVELLLKNGANVAMQNYIDDSTPMQMASEKVRKFMAESATDASAAEMVRAAVADSKNLSFAMMKQNDLQSSALSDKLRAGRKSKVEKLIQSAVKAQEQQDESIRRAAAAQRDSFQRKIERGARKPVRSKGQDDAKEQMAQLWHGVERQVAAQAMLQKQAADEFTEKLNRGKRQPTAQQQQRQQQLAKSADDARDVLQKFRIDNNRASEARQRAQQSQMDAMELRMAKAQQRNMEQADKLNLLGVFSTLDVTGKGRLGPQVVMDFHQSVHFCSISLELVLDVLRAPSFRGHLTRDTFLDGVEKLHVACRRHSVFSWDFALLDSEFGPGTGTVAVESSSLLLACNPVSRNEYIQNKPFLEHHKEITEDANRIAYHEFYNSLFHTSF